MTDIADSVTLASKPNVSCPCDRTITWMTMADDIRSGLTARRRQLPSMLAYDEYGQELFEQSCRVPEYYQAAAEKAILSDRMVQASAYCNPRNLIDLGCGTGAKTMLVVELLEGHCDLRDVLAVDHDADTARACSIKIRDGFPDLRTHWAAADVVEHVPRFQNDRKTLFTLLGITIGNFSALERSALLENIAKACRPGDLVAVSLETISDPEGMCRSYDDDDGVTAALNKNILKVLNRAYDANFNIECFRHGVRWDPVASQIELYLEADRNQYIDIKGLGLSVSIERGETITTFVSTRFEQRSFEQELRRAGLQPVEWKVDDSGRLAISSATVSSSHRSGRVHAQSFARVARPGTSWT